MVQVDDSKWTYLLQRLHEQSHKQRESFVINFILMNLLSDGYTDVNPVLQQPIKQDHSSGKREAIDLYFPQINLGIEIDEDQHFNDENRIEDKKRTRRIKDKLNPVDIGSSSYTEKRINVQKSRSLNDVITESRQVVQLVEFMINNARRNDNYEPWLTMEERQEKFNKRPVYRPGMNIMWRTHKLATKSFVNAGWKFALGQSGLANIYSDETKTQKIASFWFPIIKTKEEAIKDKSSWFNEIKADRREIIEYYIGDKVDIYEPDLLPRITFKKGYDYYTNYHGNQYLGVYKYDPSKSTLKERHYVLEKDKSVINLIEAIKEEKKRAAKKKQKNKQFI